VFEIASLVLQLGVIENKQSALISRQRAVTTGWVQQNPDPMARPEADLGRASKHQRALGWGEFLGASQLLG
jgi:hypothetical protein